MKKKKIYPFKGWMVLIAKIFCFFFTFRYNIKGNVPKEVRYLKSPYLVLGNHIGFWDPFVLDRFLPGSAHFVFSDAALKNPIFKFFLLKLGAIPKRKNIRDTKVIRDILGVIHQGDNVGLFPEAVRSWAGYTFPIDKSIAKLIKNLDVAVVCGRMKGMNHFNPRWGTELRKTKVFIDYQLLFKAGETKTLNIDQIYHQLIDALQHDEVDFQKMNMIPIRSKRKAEYISHALYVCPQCHAIDSFRCAGNEFKCIECNYDILINDFDFYERISKGNLFFDNIRDWYKWQEPWLLECTSRFFKEKDTNPIIRDKASKLYFTDENGKLNYKDDVDVSLYYDRIEMISNINGEILTMNFDELDTINPQVKEHLEIFYNGAAYRLIGGRLGVSALKWEVAMNAIWRHLGQSHKLSPYIDSSHLV